MQGPQTVINIVGNNTTVSMNALETKDQSLDVSDSVCNCYPTDFNYHPRIKLDQQIQNIKKGRVQILHGPVGTGKRSAALQFIENTGERFAVRWRVNCSEDNTRIRGELTTELAERLKLKSGTPIHQLFQVIKEKARKEDIIFLLDNAQVQKKPRPDWLNELWRIKDFLYIMATSYDGKLSLDFPGAEMISVDKFDEALEFLKEDNQINEENSDDDLKELCVYFGWNVLGITAAKRYIISTDTSVKDYLEMIRDKSAVLDVREEEQKNQRQHRILYTAVRACLENIAIDKERFPVVAAISLISHENIPEFVLSEIFRSNSGQTSKTSAFNNLIRESFFLKLLTPILKENSVRLLSCQKFTQVVIHDLLDEDKYLLRQKLIYKLAGILVKYFNKDNRYKKGAFMQRIMVNHAEVFLKHCQCYTDDRILIASARLSELVAFTYTQLRGPVSEDSLKMHFQRSEDILHQLCGVSSDDFQAKTNCHETDSGLQSLCILDDDVTVAQQLFEKLSQKSSQLPGTIVQELAFSRPVSSTDLSFFPAEVREDNDLKKKVRSFEPLSDKDLNFLVSKGVAYSVDDYRQLFLPELYASTLYSFGRNYFYLNKQSIQDANVYVSRLKLAYCISREISKRMKPGEAVMHEYLAQSNALLYLLVNGEHITEDGSVEPKESGVHCQDLKSAIKHYQVLSENKEMFFEMGILKKQNGDTYSQLVCQQQIVHCYLVLMSPKMTTSSEERDTYVKDGAKHCDILSKLSTEDGNEKVRVPSRYLNVIGEFYLATDCNHYLLRAWRTFTISAKDAEEEKELPDRFYVQAVVGLADVLSRFGKQCFIAAKMSNRQLKHCHAIMEKYLQIQHQLHGISEKVIEIERRNECSIENYFVQLWRRGGDVKPVQDTDGRNSQIAAQKQTSENYQQIDDANVSSTDAKRRDHVQCSPSNSDKELEESEEPTCFSRSRKQDLAQKIPGQWKEVARYLDLPDGKIDEIAINDRNDVVEQAYQMLRHWWVSCDAASWSECLGKALCKVGRNDLAKEFADYSAPDEHSTI